MWTMGYNNVGGEFDNIQDSFNSNRLRPLAAVSPASFLSHIHGADLLALNHQIASMTEQNKRERNTHQVVVSSRWCPTPEQLQALEELYRRGTRTPSAEQIQHITAQLRRYGKIEGKNVFYWFQNHKARERQKRRRQISHIDTLNAENKNSYAGATNVDGEQIKNWATSKNSSTTNAAEKPVSTQRVVKPKETGAELMKADRRVPLDDKAELLQQLDAKNATWQMMNLSCSSLSSTNIITTSDSPSTVTTTTVASSIDIMIKPHHHHHHHHQHDFNFYTNFVQPDYINAVSGGGDNARILQLFPLESDRKLKEDLYYDQKQDSRILEISDNTTTFQFFEFLPLKN